MRRAAPTAPRGGGAAPPPPPPRQRAPPRRRAARAPPRAAADPSAAPAAPPLDAAAGLARLDALLAAGREPEAVALAEELKAGGALRGFGAAAQVPKRAYSIAELRLNGIETTEFLAPSDSTLDGVRTALQAAALVGLVAGAAGGAFDASRAAQGLLVGAFLLTADQVGSGGGGEVLVVDTVGRLLSLTYAHRVALHEAGHFLIAYLLGLLPRAYSLSALDAFLATRALNVQAGTQFCDGAFQAEVAAGQLKSASLDAYACVALAGVATEWLRFGRAEGGVADVAQLDALLRAAGFTQKKADDQVRWAVLNVVALLRRHERAHDALAAAMGRGASAAACIGAVEEALAALPDDAL
jgi:hypothetical protein